MSDDKKRIDIVLSKRLGISRSKVKERLLNGDVLVNGAIVNPSYILKDSDDVFIKEKEEEVLSITAECMDIDIVYEDEYLAIINKKSGVVVHPAVGNYSHTLVNGLMYHFNSISNSNSIRPGIVHRLDKDTSGLMVVAKRDDVHEMLSNMIKNKQVERRYVALVWGVLLHDRGTIDAPIGRDIKNRQKYSVSDINSKDSITHFKVLKRYKDVTLIECLLDTGRTHQIRVHLDYINHPVVNDPLYGNRKMFDLDFGQMLHSKSIKFVHPITNKTLEFEVDVPLEFKKILENFAND